MGPGSSFLDTVCLSRLPILCGAVLAAICCAPTPLRAQAGGAGWSLAALIPPGSAPVGRGTPLWIDLRNETDTVRLVCLQGAIVALKSPDVASARGRTLAGAGCAAMTDFVLVRPGNALSAVVYVKPRRGALRGDSEPLIELMFLERSVAEAASSSRRIAVRWVGTLADAQRAGQRLLTAD
jgi:hypothetical protein